MFPPNPFIQGNVKASSPLPCTPEAKAKLRQTFIDTMTKLNTAFGLCSGGCNYDDVTVTCDGNARRKRRQANTDFGVTFSIPVNQYVDLCFFSFFLLKLLIWWVVVILIAMTRTSYDYRAVYRFGCGVVVSSSWWNSCIFWVNKKKEFGGTYLQQLIKERLHLI